VCVTVRPWTGNVTSGEQIAAREKCSVRKINMTISLAFIAPDLVKAAVACRAGLALPAVRHAILELFARLPPQRCPHCQKWIWQRVSSVSKSAKVVLVPKVMARKRRISKRKIRLRFFFRRFAETEVEAIDRFRAHVRDAAAAQRRSIERRANDLPSEVQEFLADDMHELDAISDLTDQLAVVALYRVVEIQYGPDFGAQVRSGSPPERALFRKAAHVSNAARCRY
jgi:hypothetical protein